MFSIQGRIIDETRIVERAFGVGPCVVTGTMAWLQDHHARSGRLGRVAPLPVP